MAANPYTNQPEDDQGPIAFATQAFVVMASPGGDLLSEVPYLLSSGLCPEEIGHVCEACRPTWAEAGYEVIVPVLN